MTTTDESVKRIADAVQRELGWGGIEEELLDFLVEVEMELNRRLEREYQAAAEQDSWETRYYHERDYGGRL